MRAPELPQDFVWLNTPRPISLRELRGHLVILDFWTYCCINCMHVVPVLDALEERHRHDPVVVIGVHSAKFEGERDPERIADAIERYGIRHPVVVDRDMQIWHSFAIRSWPTLVVVRPDGTIAAVGPGEPDPAVIEQFVREEIDRARSRGVLADKRFDIERLPARPQTVLSFPGKVDVAPDGRIAVSDSGHHRVLILSPDGEVLDTIGTGAQGRRDGAFAAAELDDPQGVRFDHDGKVLFVADARSHTILRADLHAQTIETIAGTGTLGVDPIGGPSEARKTRLRSPWDLAFAPGRRAGSDDGDKLYVALAGSHQIGVLDLAKGTIARVAGTGAESMVDGPFEEATFSQPSGLALSGNDLWIADSETSAVRVLDLARRTVRTVVGVGLFDFGDIDGPAEMARLQHCLGVTLGPDRAPYVADTYNHKIRRVDPATGHTDSFFQGADGHILREPGGVAWDARRHVFVVADTGHGRLVEISTDGGKAVVIEVRGASSPLSKRGRTATEPPPPSRATSWFTAVLDEAEPLGVGEATIQLVIVPTGGLHLAHRSHVKATLEVSRRSDLLVAKRTSLAQEVHDPEVDTMMSIPVTISALPSAAVPAEILVTIECIACSDGGIGTPAACIPLRSLVRLPVRLAKDGAKSVKWTVPIGDPG